MSEIDKQFEIALKWANEMLYTGIKSDADIDREQKIIESCAIYFSSRNKENNDNSH